jgi:hypothetical protein
VIDLLFCFLVSICSFDANGNPNGGIEFTLTVRGSVPGDSSFGVSTATPSVGLAAVASAVGEYGTYLKSFPFGLTAGWPKLLNNSKYFVRNGDGIQQCTYIVGNVRLIPETVPEQFNGVLRAWNAQNDVLGGLYPGIASLAHYQSQFYAHILSLNVTNEHDIYTVSGLNCSAILHFATPPVGSPTVAHAMKAPAPPLP